MSEIELMPQHNRRDVYWAKIEAAGDTKIRPWLVVSSDANNRGADVTMVPLSTAKPRNPNAVLVVSGKRPSYAQADHMTTVKRSSLGRYYFTVTEDEMKLVDAAMVHVLSDVKPRGEEPMVADIRDVASWKEVLQMDKEIRKSYLINTAQHFSTEELIAHWKIKKQAYYSQRHLLAITKLSAPSATGAAEVDSCLSKIHVVSKPEINYPAPTPPQRTAEEKAAYARKKIEETVAATLDVMEQKRTHGVAMSFVSECSGTAIADKLTAFGLIIENNKYYKIELKLIEIPYVLKEE